MNRWWSKSGAGLSVLLSLLGACSSGTNGSSSTPGPEPVEQPDESCRPGKSCYCGQGSQGITVCDGEQSACECPECPSLEVVEAPRVTACGGEPFGTWRLTKMELGVSKLSLSSFGMPVGECDMSTVLSDEVPTSLMTLSDGGDAEYFSESVSTRVAWSDSCVTSKVSQFGCGDDAWTGVFNCSKSCDICTCDSRFSSSTDEGTWERTASKLTLAPWGQPTSFDYCVKDGVLALSAEGAYLEYEPANLLDAPEPCAGRTPEQCVAGRGCTLGACVGEADCDIADIESECLTMKGCTWDAAQCQGTGQLGCALADYGRVPGCDFIEKPLRCTGEPPACSTLTSDTCTDLAGCSVKDTGRCSGPSLACEDFRSCPIGCEEEDGDCFGTTSCSTFQTQLDCAEANDNLLTRPCKWESSWCGGEPTPCAEYSQRACASVPGCKLEEVP